MVEAINKYMKSLNKHITKVDSNDSLQKRNILELIGGCSGSGKSTLVPNAYEFSKHSEYRNKINSLDQETTSNLFVPSEDNTTFLLQLVEFDMLGNSELIQVVNTFNEIKMFEPYLSLAIKYNYEVIIKLPEKLLYYHKDKYRTLNDQIKHLTNYNARKRNPLTKETVNYECSLSLNTRQWYNTNYKKNEKDPSKWLTDVLPFMHVKKSRKYVEEADETNDIIL